MCERTQRIISDAGRFAEIADEEAHVKQEWTKADANNKMEVRPTKGIENGRSGTS